MLPALSPARSVELSAGRSVPAPVALVLVAVFAFVARLTPMLRGGGLSGSDGYDDSVYYAAATALVHGRAPYRDFLLLHPPGLILALTPFAALGQLLSDRTGQELARLAFMLLGAGNSVLALRLGRRFGRVAGTVAGLAYAVSFPLVYAERTTTLEALGSTTLLVALTLLDPRPPSADAGTRRFVRQWPRGVLVGAGVALGLGAGVKIWGVVPLAVVAAWVGMVAGRRAVSRLLVAAGTTLAAVCLPFFLAAPTAMWQDVVLDQLGRPRSHDGLLSRLSRLLALPVALPHVAAGPRFAVLGLLLLVGVAALVTASRIPGASVLVALLVANAGVLLAGPHLYLHYTAFAACPGFLVLAVAVGRWESRLRSAGYRSLPAVVLAASLAGGCAYATPGLLRAQGKRLSLQLSVAAARVPGCITADDPTYLIAMNVLSRNLAAGCPVWIDPTGIAIDQARRTRSRRAFDSATNPAWQQLVTTYLLSGDATLVARRATHLNRTSQRRIDALPVLTSRSGFTLRQVPRTSERR